MCHYYAYRGGAQEAYFQGKLYGEGHYYHRYPATAFFHISLSFTQDDDDDDDAFDRDCNEAWYESLWVIQ